MFRNDGLSGAVTGNVSAPTPSLNIAAPAWSADDGSNTGANGPRHAQSRANDVEKLRGLRDHEAPAGALRGRAGEEQKARARACLGLEPKRLADAHKYLDRISKQWDSRCALECFAFPCER